jgi:hypothetical protein
MFCLPINIVIRRNELLLTAAILGIGAGASTLNAQQPDETVQQLKQKNDALEQRVKILEDQLNQKLNQLERQVDQVGKISDRKRELEKETLDSKFQEVTSKFKTADWLTSVKFFGDVRMRYDAAYAPADDFVTRWRFRPRLRVGALATLKDDWEIGFRLASTPSVGKDSGGDPLSTNQSFEDNASRKPVGVDWVFARWTPLHTADWTGSIAIGKLENPPNFTEDVFDVDYTPEGLAEQFSYKINANHNASAYFGQYMLDEQAFSGKDSFLFLEQIRLESKWNKEISSALTLSGLSIANPRGLTTTNVPDSNHGNTRDSAGVLQNDYQLLITDGKLTYSLESIPFYKGPFPISLSGEYIHNFGARDRNIGYSFGPSFGRVTQTGKVQKGNWEISYRYQELQGDMNYEELTASDNGVFYRSRPVGEPAAPGATAFRPQFFNGINLRGHAFRAAYAPFESLVLDLRVWLNEPIDVSSPADKVQGVRVLTDLVWKF